jgi:hypothetical protein
MVGFLFLGARPVRTLRWTGRRGAAGAAGHFAAKGSVEGSGAESGRRRIGRM